MKKLLIILISLMFCQGCILMSDGYYETQQKEWEAHQATAEAYNSRIETKIVEVNPDGVITVYNQNQAKPILIPRKQNAFVRGLDIVLNSAVGKLLGGGWAAGYFASQVQSDYTDNSVNENWTDDNSDNSTNETADPTIVEQPDYNDPIIIE